MTTQPPNPPRRPGLREIPPDFTVLNSAGEPRRLYDLVQSRSVVLLFYRGHWCPFCKQQLAAYRDRHDAFGRAGADVYALSVDSPERSAEHKHHLRLPFELLCDPDHAVVRAWDLYNRWEHGGVARPAVFVLASPDGRVRARSIDRMASRVPPEKVLAALKALDRHRLGRRLVVPRLGDLMASMLGR